MYYSSNIFLFQFLPIVLIACYVIQKWVGLRASMFFLVAASLYFYGAWNEKLLSLLIGSIAFNLIVVQLMHAKITHNKPVSGMLWLGISFNLILLGVFKYTIFAFENINMLFGANLQIPDIVLPIGISFFTFQQIAFLVDFAKGKEKMPDIVSYTLFVTFFPQLIAGPIVHHKEIIPQFSRFFMQQNRGQLLNNLFLGSNIFIIGLFKKTVLAAQVGMYSNEAFRFAESLKAMHSIDAWGGLLAFTFEIYFDFSGYSDMAIGLGLMLGIRLPINFNSPYKATSITDFWKRWHITLSRFLRDYLYIPLGGNRKGATRTSINLMLTMLIGGLWHGAGWNFIIWGGLHGLYLLINHHWEKLLPQNSTITTALGSLLRSTLVSRTLTFLAVVIAWGFFRAETLPGAMNLISSMFGINQGVVGGGISFGWGYWLFCSLLVAFVWLTPNTQEIFSYTEYGKPQSMSQEVALPFTYLRQPAMFTAYFLLLTVVSVYFASDYNAFIYFQF
ncbi:MAG: MBOAT family protein [Magnetococcales bacterium]|nr:MBOAT family protein [Magnetococcales bacterium]